MKTALIFITKLGTIMVVIEIYKNKKKHKKKNKKVKNNKKFKCNT